MKLSLQRADEFNADFEQQYRWYADKGGEEIAEHFLRAVADTLPRPAELSDLGRHYPLSPFDNSTPSLSPLASNTEPDHATECR